MTIVGEYKHCSICDVERKPVTDRSLTSKKGRMSLTGERMRSFATRKSQTCDVYNTANVHGSNAMPYWRDFKIRDF